MHCKRPMLCAAALSVAGAALLSVPAAWSQAPAPAPAAIVDGPRIKWQFSVSGRARPYTKGIEFIAKYVSDRSGGKFFIDIGYRGRFSPERENLEAIRVGVLDGAALCIYAQPWRTPAATALDLPFLPIAGFDQARTVHEAYFADPFVIGELARWNARFLLAAIVPQYEVMGVGEPPIKIDDWKGKRVRASGNIGRGLEALGASLSEGTMNTAAAGLKGGKLDAVALPFTYAHTGYAIPRAAKWYTENLSPGTINCPYVISIKTWDRLPAQYRQLIEEARPGAYAVMRDAYRDFDTRALEGFAKSNIIAVKYNDADLAAIRAVAGKPYWEAWVKDMDAKGVPGRHLLDLIFETAGKSRAK